MRLPVRCSFPLAGLLLAGLAAGCGKEEELRQYTIAHETPPDLAAFAPPAPVDGPKSRTLGAMVPAGERTWYFKAQGPADALGEQMAGFLELVRSVKLSQKSEPEWTLPEGWTQEAGGTGSSGITRLATLKTAGETPMEVSVIALDGDIANEDYLLANVNRWRSELGLKKVTAKSLFRESAGEEVRKVDFEIKGIVLVNLLGVIQPKGMGGAPFAGGKTPPRSAPPGAGGPGPLTYTTPEGWKPGEASGMRKAAFSVSEGDKSVSITVVPLTAERSGGNVLDNVNRWREQLGLAKIEQAELDAMVKPLDIDGAKGHFVALTGPKKVSGKTESILAVMAVRGGSAWFFKLQGDAELAAREKTKFEEFVKSVKFR